METHVKVLGALNIVFGLIGVLGAIALMLILGGAASVVSASGDPDAAFALPIIGITGMTLVAFLLILSIPGIIIGIGMLNLSPWARVAGIVVSILWLMLIPFGTVLGVYGIWVLFSKETERLFRVTSVSPPASPN